MFEVHLPPERGGPWRPAGHGPEPIGGDTCICGETGITGDGWPSHIAEAATREGLGLTPAPLGGGLRL